ncbi:MAG: hypothetical protein LBB34_02960 [Holosporales bacterium]|jgi:hypothetical protein|nr:hypothetical protein [Holosporales bacterium]
MRRLLFKIGGARWVQGETDLVTLLEEVGERIAIATEQDAVLGQVRAFRDKLVARREPDSKPAPE